MAKANASKTVKPAPKKNASKVRKASSAAPTSQGLRKSERETKLSSRALEALSSAPPPQLAPPPTKKAKTVPTKKPTRRQYGTKKDNLNEVVQDAIIALESGARTNSMLGISDDTDATLSDLQSVDVQSNNGDRTSVPKETSIEVAPVVSAPPVTTKPWTAPVQSRTFPPYVDPDVYYKRKLAEERESELRATKKTKRSSYQEPSSQSEAPVAYSGPEVTREELHDDGWISEELPKGFRRTYLPACRLPSPFVLGFGDRQEELHGLVDKHVHGSVRRLWEDAHDTRTIGRTEIVQRNALPADGSCGGLYAYMRTGHGEFETVYHGIDDDFVSIEL